MKYLLTIVKDGPYEGLDDLMNSLTAEGMAALLLKPDTDSRQAEDVFGTGYEKDAFILTDCDEGVVFACGHDVGYAFLDIGRVRDEEGFIGFDRFPYGPVCIIEGFAEVDHDFLIRLYERFLHIPWTILSTERLTLREMTVDDVDRMYEVYEDPSITEFTEPLYEDRQEEREYTKAYIRNQYEFFGYGLWVVIDNSSGRIIGRAGITNRDGYDEAEIGYVIMKSEQNRGYATEALRAIIRYASTNLGMKGLNCFIEPGNEVSVRLCTRLGFEHIEDVSLNGIMLCRYHKDLRE